jgi:hypothetical protein
MAVLVVVALELLVTLFGETHQLLDVGDSGALLGTRQAQE